MTAPEIRSGPGTGPRDSKRAPRLDGLRGYLALGVVLVHVAFSAGIIGFYDQPGNGIWAVMLQGLNVLLPPFFVMSGLLLYRPFARATIAGARKPDVRQYLLRRALRILPAYWLVAVVALFLLDFRNIDGLWYVASPLLLLHYYVPGPEQGYAGLEPTWTVPAEMTFYLALPLLAWAIDRYARRGATPRQRTRRMLVPLGLLVVAGLAWTAYSHLPSLGPFPYEYFWVFGFTGFLAIGMGLAALAAYAETTDRVPRFYRLVARRPLMFWLGALVVFVVNCIRPFGKPGMADYATVPEALVEMVLFLAFALLIISPVVVPNVHSRFLDAVLTNRPMRFFGRISYGVYLWHFIIQYLWLRNGSVFGDAPLPMPAVQGRAGFWDLMAATMVGSVAVATLSYYLFELPAMRLRNRLTSSAQEAGGRPPAPEQPAREERSPMSV
ncbi:acyltransferase family protein [Sphaerimonospora thailandensis]|uniref:Acyltransferase n=1 Tax=Sphaerimonospora thailandensis TaxID=795644 RepID=A0A8J3R5B5_9ACTN|nr:acyltransferase [Sphaerimonospora thailandensis]GIH67794.1 acyltransferase [Sphaerimonospora thailandensis]